MCAPDPLQTSHACQRFSICYKTLTFFSLLTRCRIPYTCHRKCQLNVQEWSEHVVPLTIFTSKCALRHNGVHFFAISTLNSQKWSETVSFNTFNFKVCFAPQRCELFRHLNFQKWSGAGVLYILTWKCASRHNGVQFFIWPAGSAPAALASLLFDPLEPQII